MGEEEPLDGWTETWCRLEGVLLGFVYFLFIYFLH